MNGTEKQNETSMEIPAEDSRVTMGNQTEKKHRFHLKMPQKGRKHSVKKRIAYTFIATMAATLLIIGLINYFFLGSFYIRDKEHILAESFQKLNATGGDSDDIPDTFEQFCVTNNLKVIITGPELSSFVYSNATDRQSLQTLIFGLINAFIRPVVTFFSGCLVLITFGLFLLVINAAMLMLSAWILGQFGVPFTVSGWGAAFGGSIIISVVSALLNGLTGVNRRVD